MFVEENSFGKSETQKTGIGGKMLLKTRAQENYNSWKQERSAPKHDREQSNNVFLNLRKQFLYRRKHVWEIWVFSNQVIFNRSDVQEVFFCQSRIHIFTDSQLYLAGIHSSPKRNAWKCSTQSTTAPPNGILAPHMYAVNVPPKLYKHTSSTETQQTQTKKGD